MATAIALGHHCVVLFERTQIIGRVFFRNNNNNHIYTYTAGSGRAGRACAAE